MFAEMLKHAHVVAGPLAQYWQSLPATIEASRKYRQKVLDSQ
jgi:hypothetical protein